MIKIYKGQYTETKSEFQKMLDEYTSAVKEHPNTVGVPYPRHNFEIIEKIHDSGGKFTWVSSTRIQEEEKRIKAQFDKIEKERLSYVGKPSDRYKEFRQAEYWPIGDQLDAIIEGLAFMSKNGAKLGKECKALIDAVAEVKKRYPKK